MNVVKAACGVVIFGLTGDDGVVLGYIGIRLRSRSFALIGLDRRFSKV